MCGLTGFLSSTCDLDYVQAVHTLRHMSDKILHRGPDNDGYWVDSDAGIGIAHRRLAIVDLSPAGAQPMFSTSGRYVLAFNGEIYNHQHMRRDLERERNSSLSWRGHSDTETLLAGFDTWGIVSTLKRANGMFAIALWDRELRTLTLARDRLGEKPLYYGWQSQGGVKAFLFGSELSALSKHPAFTSKVNRDALALYMRHNCIGGESSIYSGIKKLAPGQLLTVSQAKPDPIVLAWWSVDEIAELGVSQPFDGSPAEAVDALESLLSNAVAQQMMSDVPLGAFLSGGIDSSTVVALMQSQTSRPVRTFSIGFHEDEYNEAEHAKAVANHLGTDHTELYVSPSDALAVIPKLPTIYSEPFADSSQIPTFLVSQLARQHVTVSLSGDAGDELFCGYNRYQMTAGLWKRISLFPRPLRQLTAGIITSVPPNTLDRLGDMFSKSRLGDKLHKGAGLLGSRSVAELYQGMVTHWEDPASVVLNSNESDIVLPGSAADLSGLGDVESMMVLDMLGYLPNDILTKVDRAAMGVSLETRVPMLDHRVVEFALSLPLSYKLREGVTKWPLRQVLYRHVPRELIERPKMGFGVPIGDWLRGPLREWAETLLAEPRLKSEGFFNPVPIRKKWVEHLTGKRNWQYHLWDVLMFQAWLEANPNAH